jgi:large subunit ribosomal protein L21e
MVQRKRIRTRGKLSLSRYFQELNEGDRVAIVKETSVASSFPERMQGRTGVVLGKRGNACIIRIKDHEKEKTFIIPPIHLKKIISK